MSITPDPQIVKYLDETGLGLVTVNRFNRYHVMKNRVYSQLMEVGIHRGVQTYHIFCSYLNYSSMPVPRHLALSLPLLYLKLPLLVEFLDVAFSPPKL